jgi:excisionase family DNA binding protein
MTDLQLSTIQAAELLGVSTRRVQALISTGLLNANKMGRDWLISEAEVQRFAQHERKAGRPSKNQPKMDSDERYVNQPSNLYLQVVEIIRMLIDHEGIDHAQRAFAQAAFLAIRSYVTSHLKPRSGSHVCHHRLLGKKKCPDTFEHPCDSPNFPGQDHISEWTRDGKTVKIISQPYGLSYETLRETVKYCEKHGLRADISPESWHFPGRTLRIDYSVNNKPDGSLSGEVSSQSSKQADKQHHSLRQTT